MFEKKDLGRLLDYTNWANHRVLRASAVVSVADFRRDLGSSHGGIRGTLTHMLSAEALWLERWKGVSAAPRFDESEFPDVLALRERWVALEDHRAVWFRSLKKAAVSQVIRYQTLAGETRTAPLWQLVQHTANHSTYHRGQVVALLRILGRRGVTTDMAAWDRDRALKSRGD
jgi:uncharacterized damage-inducible protein DinB